MVFLHFCEKVLNASKGISVNGHHAVVLHKKAVYFDGSESARRQVGNIIVLQNEDIDLSNSSSQHCHRFCDPAHHAVRTSDLKKITIYCTQMAENIQNQPVLLALAFGIGKARFLLASGSDRSRL